MCVETLTKGLIFPRWLIWEVTCLGLLKNECFPIYLLGNCINDCWNPQNRVHFIFLRWSIWGVRSLSLLKIWTFSHLSQLKTLENVCSNPENRAHFSQMIDLRGHMPRFTLKMNTFPIYLLGNPINVCSNPKNRTHFSKTIDLRGQKPRFTQKWMFSQLSPSKP